MNTKHWTKQDRIACVIIFTICIITFVAFLSTMTLSYFYDTHSASGIITAAEVKIKAVGGPENNGQIQFPAVLTPNTQYSVSDYTTNGNYHLKYEVVNEGNSGTVYVMLKLESNYLDVIKPLLETVADGRYWVTGDVHSEYLYYMTPLGVNQSAPLCNTWQVGNMSTAIMGEAVTYKITAYAVQTQGTAINEMIAGNVDGWQYAPQIFKDMAGV